MRGYPISLLTEDDIIQFKNDCEKYDKAYSQKEATILYPTEQELLDRAVEVKNIRLKEYLEVVELSKEQVERLIALPDYKLKKVHSYIRNLKRHAETDVHKKVKQMVGTGFSRDFMNDDTLLLPSTYYTELMNFFNNK